ncbi:MAG: hypothetical protein N4A71_11060 [Carboxylicivirga sp.]|jgi:response regulator of citrate/malate metabolism|nr:hypothetical protein [Carboxylicivirga sp.]
MAKLPEEIKPSLKPKTKKELAVEFDVSRDTIRSMCKRIEIDNRGKLSIPELEVFYARYGVPVRDYAG